MRISISALFSMVASTLGVYGGEGVTRPEENHPLAILIAIYTRTYGTEFSGSCG